MQVMSPLHVKLAPVAGKPAVGMPKVNLRSPMAHPALVPSVPSAPMARVAPMAMPKVAPARPHADLNLELSPFVQDGELEVVVTILQNGAEVGGGTLLHAVPAWGASGLVSIELKRS